MGIESSSVPFEQEPTADQQIERLLETLDSYADLYFIMIHWQTNGMT